MCRVSVHVSRQKTTFRLALRLGNETVLDDKRNKLSTAPDYSVIRSHRLQRRFALMAAVVGDHFAKNILSLPTNLSH